MGSEQGGGEQGTSLGREIRGQIFVWMGIVGGALTIANHWSNFITLADWVHWVVENTSLGAFKVWHWLGTLLHINISYGRAQALTFIAFFCSLVVGSTVLGHGVRRFHTKDVVSVAIASLLFLILIAVFAAGYAGEFNDYISSTRFYVLVILALMLIAGGDLSIRFIVSLELMAVYYAAADLTDWFVFVVEENSTERLALLVTPLILLLPLLVAPTAALAKRLAFLLAGVAIIFGLSEFSKLAERLHTAASAVQVH